MCMGQFNSIFFKICLPLKHLGVLKTLLKCVRTFQINGIWKLCFFRRGVDWGTHRKLIRAREEQT